MTTSKKDYSDYLVHLSNSNSSLALFSGFLLTGITILLTALPDPSSIRSQVILFFLTVLWNLRRFSLQWLGMQLISLCRSVPPLSEVPGMRTHNKITLLSDVVGRFVLPLMYLLWNLDRLALATTAVGVLFLVIYVVFGWRPYLKRREASRPS